MCREKWAIIKYIISVLNAFYGIPIFLEEIQASVFEQFVSQGSLIKSNRNCLMNFRQDKKKKGGGYLHDTGNSQN